LDGCAPAEMAAGPVTTVAATPAANSAIVVRRPDMPTPLL
jgi:hypothetical protein